YGTARLLRKSRKETPQMQEHLPPLDVRVEQMLTEARVLIPGAGPVRFSAGGHADGNLWRIGPKRKNRPYGRTLLYRTRRDPAHGAGRFSPDCLWREQYRSVLQTGIISDCHRRAAAGIGHYARPLCRGDPGLRNPPARSSDRTWNRAGP